ncbi:chemotaxis protein CheW [Halioxenophilus sp. WMMB6]|uniref:chemotaxis protein CheW n=1 Tax=Halioxenophilus sp. WMMB6 TaxID=3073815 RepID=UPI00295F30C0|nr:chemotaxis protein CheW [Halioxenophilus sp. WMMB6]
MSQLLPPSQALRLLSESAPPDVDASHERLHYLEYFAVELAGMGLLLAAELSCELIDSKALCVLPASPEILAGVLSVRSQVVPIFDLRFFLAPGAARESRKPLIRFALVHLNGTRSWGLALEKMPEKRRFSGDDHRQTELPENIRTLVTQHFMTDRLWCEFNWQKLFSRLAA